MSGDALACIFPIYCQKALFFYPVWRVVTVPICLYLFPLPRLFPKFPPHLDRRLWPCSSVNTCANYWALHCSDVEVAFRRQLSWIDYSLLLARAGQLLLVILETFRVRLEISTFDGCFKQAECISTIFDNHSFLCPFLLDGVCTRSGHCIVLPYAARWCLIEGCSGMRRWVLIDCQSILPCIKDSKPGPGEVVDVGWLCLLLKTKAIFSKPDD